MCPSSPLPHALLGKRWKFKSLLESCEAREFGKLQCLELVGPLLSRSLSFPSGGGANMQPSDLSPQW